MLLLRTSTAFFLISALVAPPVLAQAPVAPAPPAAPGAEAPEEPAPPPAPAPPEGASAMSEPARPDGAEPGGLEADRFQQQYLLGRSLYGEGRYVEAGRVFGGLFWAPDPLQRKAAVSYALGQCLRLLGNFPGALHAYQRALDEYAREETDEAHAWRSAAADQLSVVSTNLAVVELVRPQGSSTDTRLCSLRVDGRASVRYEQAQLDAWPLADPRSGSSAAHRRDVAAGLLDGGLFGVEGPPGGSPPEEHCYTANVRIVVDRTQDHLVEYSWVRGRQAPQSAAFRLLKSQIETGSRKVPLEQLAALVSVRFTDEGGNELPAESVRRVSAFLAPLGEGPELPIAREREQKIAAGDYKLFVNASDWIEGEPVHMNLRPGETRTVDIPLSKPRFYEQSWFPWAIAGAAVGALFVTYVVVNSDGEPKPAPEVWTVEIP
jgi:hypothetical protein